MKSGLQGNKTVSDKIEFMHFNYGVRHSCHSRKMSATNQVTRTTIQVRPARNAASYLLLRRSLVDLIWLLLQLYRDCLRLAKHIGGNVRLLEQEGPSHQGAGATGVQQGPQRDDPEKIEVLKAKYVAFAVRGLSNYLMLANSSKDQRLHDAMNKKSPPKDDGPEQAEYRDL
ncbi:hypothetical protein GQ600_18278 [Phytophthora cactorum]|nr:hypothetical protein GQ600_18278 [Phytophthora cactorum]